MKLNKKEERNNTSCNYGEGKKIVIGPTSGFKAERFEKYIKNRKAEFKKAQKAKRQEEKFEREWN